MKLPLFAAIAATAAFIAIPAGHASRFSYWTTAQAEAAVLAQATVPYCAYVRTDSAHCANGKPVPGAETQVHPIRIIEAKCTGTAGFAKGGLYRRFTCTVDGVNQLALGRLDVYTAGPARIRWKRLA